MRKIKRVLLSSVSMISPVLAAACTVEKGLSNNLLSALDWTPGSTLETSYENNLIFWAFIANATSNSQKLTAKQFIDLLNSSKIIENPLQHLPNSVNFEILDLESSLNINDGSDKLAFNLIVDSSRRRYELRWKVKISNDQYLDAWISKVPSNTLSTTIHDHNRLVNYLIEGKDMEWESDESLTNELIGMINDLDRTANIPQFGRSGLFLSNVKALGQGLKIISQQDLINNNFFGLSLDVIFKVDQEVTKRTIVFNWEIETKNQTATASWTQNSRLSISLENFNKLLNDLEIVKDQLEQSDSQIKANVVINIIKGYSDNANLATFTDSVELSYIGDLKRLTESSKQETLRFGIVDASNLAYSDREIKLDFAVHATHSDVVKLWALPNVVQKITPNDFAILTGQLAQIDYDDIEVSSIQFWTALSRSFVDNRIPKFPEEVEVDYDISQFKQLGNLKDGTNVSLRFRINIGSSSKEIVANYMIVATEQDEFDNLQYNHSYNLTATEFNLIRNQLVNLPVGTNAKKISEVFTTVLPQGYKVPEFPDFAKLATPIYLPEHLSGQATYDIFVELRGQSASTKVEVQISRIFVSSSLDDLLNVISVDEFVPDIEADSFQRIKNDVTRNIQFGRSSPNDLAYYLGYWLPVSNLPVQAVVSSIIWPTDLSNGEISEVKFEISSHGSSKWFSYRFTFYSDFYASGLAWKSPSNIVINSSKYRELTRVINGIVDSFSNDATLLNEAFDPLFSHISDYRSLTQNIGVIDKLNRLEIYNGTQKFVLVAFDFQRDGVIAKHTIGLTIEDTPEQAFDTWNALRPSLLIFEANNFNNWYQINKNNRNFNNSDANDFFARTYVFAGLVGSLNLPSNVSIANWALSNEDFVFDNASLQLNLTLSVSTVIKNISFTIEVKDTRQNTLNSYFQLFNSSSRNLNFTASQYNEFAQSVNSPSWKSAAIFTSAFNRANPTKQMPDFSSIVNYKIDHELEYQSIDQFGSFAMIVKFQYGYDASTVTTAVFTLQITPDYVEVLNQLSVVYDQSNLGTRTISSGDFNYFTYLFNEAIATVDNYLRSLKINSLLFQYGLINSTSALLGGVYFDVSNIPTNAYLQTSFQLDLNYSVPGLNAKTFSFNFVIEKTIKDLVDIVQNQINDADITYTNFITFANQWNALGSNATNQQLLALLTTYFTGINLPNQYALIPKGVIDTSLISTLASISMSSRTYTFAVQVANPLNQAEIASILYFTFKIDLDDDAMVNASAIGNYSLSGTKKKFNDLFNYVQSNSYLGTSGKHNLLAEIKKMFDSEIRFPLNEINFRNVSFTGNWNSVHEINSANYLTIEYGYRNSTVTKTFKILITLTQNLNALIEDFANIETNELNYRSYKTFDEGFAKVRNIADLDALFSRTISSSNRPNFVQNWGSDLLLISFVNITPKLNFVNGKSLQKYLLILNLVQNGISHAISTMIYVPVAYDIGDQTEFWTADSEATSIETRDLIKAQKFFLETFLLGEVIDATQFLSLLNSEILKLDINSVIPFPSSSKVKIPETGLIDTIHLFARTNKIRIEFVLNYLETDYQLAVEIGYERSNHDLFELYTPFNKKPGASGIVEMLPSEYVNLRKDLNLTFDLSALMNVNAEVALEVIQSHLLKNGYLRQMTIPAGELNLYVSPYSHELPALEDNNNKFDDIAIKIGITTPSSALIKYFDFTIRVKSDIVDIATNLLSPTIWRGVEATAPVNIATQRKFTRDLKIVNKDDATTHTNLLTSAQLTDKLENDFGVIIDRQLHIPKPAGNKEIMFGFTKRGQNEIVKTTPFDLEHTETLEGNDFRPLSKSVYASLKSYKISDIPQTIMPSFVDNPYDHPLQTPAISTSVQGVNYGLVTSNPIIGNNDFFTSIGEDMVQKVIFNGWLNYHAKYYADDADIPISRMRKASNQGIEAPTQKRGDKNPLYAMYPNIDGPTDLYPDENLMRSLNTRGNTTGRPKVPPRRVQTTVVDTHRLPTVPEAAVAQDPFAHLYATVNKNRNPAPATAIDPDINKTPDLGSKRMKKGLGTVAGKAPMRPFGLVYPSPRTAQAHGTFVTRSMIGDRNPINTESGLIFVDSLIRAQGEIPATSNYLLTRIDPDKPIPNGVFNMSTEMRNKYPKRLYFSNFSTANPAGVLENPISYVSADDFFSGKTPVYAAMQPNDVVYDNIFRKSPFYRPKVDVIQPGNVATYFNTDKRIYHEGRVEFFDKVIGDDVFVMQNPTTTTTTTRPPSPTGSSASAKRVLPAKVSQPPKDASKLAAYEKLAKTRSDNRITLNWDGSSAPTYTIEIPNRDPYTVGLARRRRNYLREFGQGLRNSVSRGAKIGVEPSISQSLTVEPEQIYSSRRSSSSSGNSDVVYPDNSFADLPFEQLNTSGRPNNSSTCSKVFGSRCVNTAANNVNNANEIQTRSKNIKANLSRGWRNHIKKIVGVVGALTTVASLFLGLFLGGVLPVKDKSNHFENNYDNKDETGAVGVTVLNRHQITAYLVERNNQGGITKLEEVKTFGLNINSDMYDYEENIHVDNFSKPLEFLIKHLADEGEINTDFLRKKVPINSSGIPEAFKKNNEMFEGTWLGYMQMFPITQKLDAVEIAWEVLDI